MKVLLETTGLFTEENLKLISASLYKFSMWDCGSKEQFGWGAELGVGFHGFLQGRRGQVVVIYQLGEATCPHKAPGSQAPWQEGPRPTQESRRPSNWEPQTPAGSRWPRESVGSPCLIPRRRCVAECEGHWSGRCVTLTKTTSLWASASSLQRSVLTGQPNRPFQLCDKWPVSPSMLGRGGGWSFHHLSAFPACWLMPWFWPQEEPPPLPRGVQESPCRSRTIGKPGWSLPSGTLCPNGKQSSAGFDDEDLQLEVSFPGNIVCCLYEQQLHSIWYLGRQPARAEMVKCSITPRSTTPLVINIDVH